MSRFASLRSHFSNESSLYPLQQKLHREDAEMKYFQRLCCHMQTETLFLAGASICVKHWGGPIPSLPTRIPFPSFPSLPFLPSPPSLCPPSPPFPPLPLPPLMGVRGLRPRKIFFRYTCSHASFSAFLTQKSAVYLTRFPDNNFAFLHES
jgi:hypothetical protein